jgi:hypothetical protein
MPPLQRRRKACHLHVMARLQRGILPIARTALGAGVLE